MAAPPAAALLPQRPNSRILQAGLSQSALLRRDSMLQTSLDKSLTKQAASSALWQPSKA
jgi:hypothetical protein